MKTKAPAHTAIFLSALALATLVATGCENDKKDKNNAAGSGGQSAAAAAASSKAQTDDIKASIQSARNSLESVKQAQQAINDYHSNNPVKR